MRRTSLIIAGVLALIELPVVYFVSIRDRHFVARYVVTEKNATVLIDLADAKQSRRMLIVDWIARPAW